MIKRGFSLTELLVVVGIVALLMSIGIPAAKKLSESLESSDGVRSVINAALCNARATAIMEQKYAGVRFQFGTDGRQYMVLVLHDPADGRTITEIENNPDMTGTGLANGFRVIKNRKPTVLPANVGVMDLLIRFNTGDATDPTYRGITTTDDSYFDEEYELNDTTTFAIVFSPAGKLVSHEIRVRNKHGRTDDLSPDDVFNTYNNVSVGNSLLYQDDYPADGFGQEFSRKNFLIYNVEAFKKISPTTRWSGYLRGLYQTKRVFVNPHSGEIVNR